MHFHLLQVVWVALPSVIHLGRNHFFTPNHMPLSWQDSQCLANNIIAIWFIVPGQVTNLILGEKNHVAGQWIRHMVHCASSPLTECTMVFHHMVHFARCNLMGTGFLPHVLKVPLMPNLSLHVYVIILICMMICMMIWWFSEMSKYVW